jgi:transcriptional regulator with XRE-family HTH domain
MHTTGMRIATYRRSVNWTQDKLASEINIPRSMLSDIENDKLTLKLDLLHKIAEKLQIPAACLLPSPNSLVYNNNDEASYIKHNSGSVKEERSLWEALLKTKDELLEAKDKLIKLLENK